jgi:tRNA (guanosine-2'-O-)-methyltransferase
MYGFTESFNISVCAALSLFYLAEKMRANPAIDWRLTEEEQITLKLYWSMQVIHDGRRVMEHISANLFGNR